LLFWCDDDGIRAGKYRRLVAGGEPAHLGFKSPPPAISSISLKGRCECTQSFRSRVLRCPAEH
jgi:hypothetical protein